MEPLFKELMRAALTGLLRAVCSEAHSLGVLGSPEAEEVKSRKDAGVLGRAWMSAQANQQAEEGRTVF